VNRFHVLLLLVSRAQRSPSAGTSFETLNTLAPTNNTLAPSDKSGDERQATKERKAKVQRDEIERRVLNEQTFGEEYKATIQRPKIYKATIQRYMD
jgi:hypothetical protein